MKRTNFDLQERIISFSILILEIAEKMPNNYAGQHIAKQLIRSGTSPSFQYGEAQAAESRKDFIHKLKIGLKELRESMICLILIKKKPFLSSPKVDEAIKECDELISIFFTSINTAQKNIKN